MALDDTPTTQHALASSATASVDAPFVNPDALVSQQAPVANLPEASMAPPTSTKALRTTEAPTAGVAGGMDEEQQAQDFQGELMTFNDSKGWERVALVQSRGWPAHVPIPGYVATSLYQRQRTSLH
jgi:hypothetical protein